MAAPGKDALLRPRTQERHAIVAFWLTVVLTGFGHVYAREHARGVMLLVSEFVALTAMGAEDVLHHLWSPGFALRLAFLAYGAIDAVTAARPGDPRPPSGVFWLYPALAAATVAFAVL